MSGRCNIDTKFEPKKILTYESQCRIILSSRVQLDSLLDCVVLVLS